MKTTFYALVASVSMCLPVAAQESFKVGVLTDMSGPVSTFSGAGSVAAAELAIEDFGMEVLGRKIELIHADHQMKPDVAAGIAREWFESDGVEVILDVAVSSAALAVMEISNRLKKPVLLSTAAASAINGSACTAYAAQWSFDTYALSRGVVEAMAGEGAKTWFFVTSDYAFGQDLQADMTSFIEAAGGTVVGSVLHPVGTQDFASYLLQAQASGADVVVMANSGGDLVNALKQSNEFGIAAAGQKLAVPLISVPQLKALGSDAIQGVVASNGFVWNYDEKTQAWSDRFMAKTGAMPADTQAANYSALLHYLKAVEAAGTTDADTVMAQLRDMDIEDAVVRGGRLRPNGSVSHEIYLVGTKPAAGMSGEWDLVSVVSTVPGDKAFRPLSESDCPLVTE